jgi:hypothetical protein
MKKKMVFFSSVIFGVALAIQILGSNIMHGKYRLKAPNGISFSEIKGYEKLQAIAVSREADKNELRVILGNNIMVDAYKKGIPGNGKPFPEGSAIVKIGWLEKKNTHFPSAHESDVLKRVEFILKDSKRFPETSGWGYARFIYDAKTATFTPYGKDSSFTRECYQCHAIVKKKDFIFTGMPEVNAGETLSISKKFQK